MDRQEHQVFRTRIDSSGRIGLPMELRQRHGLGQGDTVILIEDAQGLRLQTVEEALAMAQAHFAQLAPSSVLLSDEINSDRRSKRERD